MHKTLQKQLAVISIMRKNGCFIKEIHLVSCNTGVKWRKKNHPLQDSFAKQLREALKHHLQVEHNITITAPTGLVGFLKSGKVVVLKDENPFTTTEKNLNSLLKTLNIDKENQVLKAVEKHLAIPGFEKHKCLPSKRFLGPGMFLKLDSNRGKIKNKDHEYYFSKKKSTVYFSEKAYYELTEDYAKREMKAEPPKSELKLNNLFDRSHSKKNRSKRKEHNLSIKVCNASFPKYAP